jgi:branched-chain amino acid transport system substrate-binding protein
MGRVFARLACGLAFFFVAAAPGGAQHTVRLALIDPLTGPFAYQGNNSMRQIQAGMEEINARGGVLGGRKLELVAFDNKSSPQETLIVLKQVIDQGIRFVAQAAGSHNAHALIEAVAKHNEREPDRSILYLNYGSVDTALTNEKCNFWHFRFDSNVDIKIDALTSAIAKRKEIRKIYLINQDYAYGHSVSRAAREMLGRKRPDIQIVADELHPIGKIKDFSPYIAKIKASGADTVLTGNWGNDLALLIRAAADAALPAAFYTNYAYLTGTPRSIGRAGDGRVKTVVNWHINLPANPAVDRALHFKKRFNEDWIFMPAQNALEMWVAAMERAGSADPLKVALALEDMRYQSSTGEVWMRKDDHQLMQPLFVATFTRVGGEVKYDLEDTGMGFKTDERFGAGDTILPTTCRMQRP